MRWSAEWPDLTVRSHLACARLIWVRISVVQGLLHRAIDHLTYRILQKTQLWIERACHPAISPKRSRTAFFQPMKLVSIPANPVPDGVVPGAIKTSDGVNLRFARWAPPPGRKGTVFVLQGRAEFIEKYFETVRDLRARGFAVATFDWRGQGLSDRPVLRSDSRAMSAIWNTTSLI